MTTRLTHFLLFTVFCFHFSCDRKKEDPKPAQVNTPVTPIRNNPNWSFSDPADGTGNWTLTGCGVQEHKITITGNTGTKYDGTKYRYFPDGKLSTMFEYDSLTGSVGNTKLNLVYKANKISELHIYSIIETNDFFILHPVQHVISYNQDQYQSSVSKVRTYGNVNASTFIDGFINLNYLYNYTPDGLTVDKSTNMNATISSGGFVTKRNENEMDGQIVLTFLNNDISKPLNKKEYVFENGTTVLKEEYSLTYDANGRVNEIYLRTGTGVNQLHRKYYWSNDLQFNSEVRNTFTLNYPFDEIYKLYPFELYFKVEQTVNQPFPEKIEEYVNGNLDNTITYTGEFNTSGKLTRLTGSHTKNAATEVHDIVYSCN